MSDHMPLFLVLSPLKSELKVILERIEQKNFTLQKLGDVYVCPEARLMLAASGHGKVQTALNTQKILLLHPQIKDAFLIGAAGALKAGVKPRDVVVATKSIEHDYRLLFISKPLPEILSPHDYAASLSPIGDFGLHIGPIASGDEDIVNTERAAELQAKTQALAVAWEGAGFARACQNCQVAWTEIRAVTDEADHKAVDSFKANLEPAMNNAFDVFWKILTVDE
ncbi:MAG: 5'-methylthioadenosine/S-adenosylhomocysteine nucleosidase [Bdellovibrionaceae bacterium]|nr:5'-methylthioadenosine/S-adenosylhomocysteine nucleosidase [Pseudobdellovibrionaceae bacterium]